MKDVLRAFFRKYEVDIACFQEHKFAGWDKVGEEYAVVEGASSSPFSCPRFPLQSCHTFPLLYFVYPPLFRGC